MENITSSEWQVMRVIWNKKEACAMEVIDSLSDSMDWKSATVKTLLGRLVKKEMLHTTQLGKKFIYSPAIDEKTAMSGAIQDLFAQVCAQKAGITLKDMIEQVELTQTDLDLLQETLLNKTPVATIACNCIKGQCTCEHQGGI
ncbi:MAG: CopY/TcrY family copper transport repressor [Streptococcaceae bacterium]|jgi:CopY/TcrY family copper transport repressor|nr:CopY/TcrY family copper transport repressor [Streptococcaceae bacterium]